MNIFVFILITIKNTDMGTTMIYVKLNKKAQIQNAFTIEVNFAWLSSLIVWIGKLTKRN